MQRNEVSPSEGRQETLDHIAAGLYSLASMLVGEGEDSVRLVVEAAAGIAAGESAAEARKSSRVALCRSAIGVLARRDAGSLAAPAALEHARTCIEDDDLEAAGGFGLEVTTMMGGPDRERARAWLASLRTEQRTIFVLRAVAGLSSAETAQLLATEGGPRAAGWTAEAVRELFRQALCSLTSQLIQETAGR